MGAFSFLFMLVDLYIPCALLTSPSPQQHIAFSLLNANKQHFSALMVMGYSKKKGRGRLVVVFVVNEQSASLAFHLLFRS